MILHDNFRPSAEMVRWVKSVNYEKIPQSIREITKYQILGLLGAIFGSLKTDLGKKVIRFYEKHSQIGEFPLPGSEKKISLKDSVEAFASLSMLLDYDDYLFMGHTGHSAVWVSLLPALALGRSSKDVIKSIVIGNEVGGRLGGAVLFGPHNGQMWSFIHGVNTALIYGKLLELPFESLLDAVGIYLYQANYPLYPGFMGSEAKIFTAARPIREGFFAVEAAEDGFSGHSRIIEAEKGFLKNFSFFPLDFMIGSWGKVWLTGTLAVKLYPGCAYIDTTMDVLSKLVQQEEFNAEKVNKVKIDANILSLQMDRIAQEFFDSSFLSPINLNFNLGINTAIFLLEKKLTPEVLTEEYLNRNRRRILKFAEKVEINHSWKHTFDVLFNVLQASNWEKFLTLISPSELRKLRSVLEEYHGSSGVNFSAFQILKARKYLDREKRIFLRKVLLKAVKERFKKNNPDFSLEDIDFSRFSMPFGVDVSIELVNGDILSGSQSVPLGASYLEGFEVDVENKFRREAGSFFSKGKIEQIINEIKSFEKKSPYSLISAIFD